MVFHIFFPYHSKECLVDDHRLRVMFSHEEGTPEFCHRVDPSLVHKGLPRHVRLPARPAERTRQANSVLAPSEPHKRRESDPSLAEAVDGLKKGKNVRFPGLLDERIEECGPNRNCYEAVKRERNASKPPLEEFLSRFLGT